MKNIIILILLLSTSLPPLIAQNTEFAPLGARWIRIGNDNSLQITEVSTVIGDTLLAGINCRIIQLDHHWINFANGTSGHNYNMYREYVYAQGDQVYYYRSGAFYTLYNFAAQVGETWTVKPNEIWDNIETGTVRVDSIGTETIDGVALRYLWLSADAGSCYGFYNEATKIVERTGTVTAGTMFPNYYVNDCLVTDFWHGTEMFRCYQDAQIFYGSGDSCVYTVDIQSPPLQVNAITCYFSHSAQTLQLNTTHQDEVYFRLYDLQGRSVMQQCLMPYQDSQSLDVSNLPASIYAYTFSNSKGMQQRGKVGIVH